jgi:lactate racemase
MVVRLRYGREPLTADLRGLRCRELRPSPPRHAWSVRDLVAEALDRPASGPSLAARCRGKQRVTVLVPDATRKAALPEVLPLVLGRLGQAGVPTSGIRVLVACGTHPASAPDDVARLVGEIPEGVEVVQHDAHDDSGLVAAGTLATGLSVRLNRLLLDAELVVAVSTVQHHYFAGFGGGPKLVFPGVAGYAEIQANHARVLDLASDPPRRHPGCEPGALAGNPVASEIMLAAALRPPDFAVMMVMGEQGQPVWVAGGPLDTVFPQACERARAWFEVPAERFNRVVVSAGGYPSDHTLIQAHKALDAACRFAADGADVVIVAACDGGAGSPAVEPFLADPRPAAIIARLAERYVQYGHTVLRLVEKTARCRVRAVTALPRELVERLGMELVDDLGAVFDSWRAEAPGETVAVMPGPPVFPSATK